MPISDFYQDHNIEVAPEGHKHHRDGWFNINCPFCTGEHDGFHLGFNTEGNYFFCWRCGPHSIPETLVKLLKVSFDQAKSISRDYQLHRSRRVNKTETNKVVKISKHPFKLPNGIVDLTTAHRRYLERRNFDPDQLAHEWGIKGTTPLSVLDGIFYKYRIFTPIHWNGEMVSFQCRDYTNKQSKKYMACPQEREIVHHKHLLYGNQEAWGDVGICVEGTFDVWRLGDQSFSTLGIGYTTEQVRLIASLFKEVVIIFDPEKQAREQAEKLQQELQFRGVKAHNYTELDSDPADLTPDDAKHLLKEFNKKYLVFN
jgi:hypothetical protein